MKPAVVRSTLAFRHRPRPAGCLQDGGAISPSHAANAAAGPPRLPPPAANRYGLPDFSALVEQVGPAVVNISVTQKVAAAAPRRAKTLRR
jgi:serine protease Do